MLLLAHAATGFLPLWLARRKRPTQIPASAPWWAALGGILPDLMDKPLGYLILDYGTGRLWGHSALFVITLGALALTAWKLGSPSTGITAGCLALGAATHLALDQMWHNPTVLWWPALGGMPHGSSNLTSSLQSYTDPLRFALEVTVLAVFLFIAARRLSGHRRSRARLHGARG